MPLMVASSAAIAACDDKAQTMALAERAGVKAPRTHLARTPEEFRAAAAELGYPERDVCMKPPQAKGSRGFRVLSATRRPPPRAARGAPRPAAALGRRGARGDRRRRLPAAARDGARDGQGAHGRRHLPRRPPGARPREDARGDARRPRDVLRDRPRSPSSRQPRGASCAELELDWFVNVQFIGEHLLEINPRISTIVYQDDLNLPVPGRPARGRRARRGAARRLRRRRAHDAARAALLRPGRVRRAVSGGGAPSARLRTLAEPVGDLRHRAGRRALRRPAAAADLHAPPRHRARSRNVGQVVALVAVGATVAQLGLVNALFRFAAEREGDARFAVARTAIALCCARGRRPRARRGARDARRGPALPRRRQRGALARGLRRPARLAALRARAPASTASSSGRSGSSPSRSSTSPSRSSSASSGSSTSTAARSRLIAGSYTGTLVALLVVLWDRRGALFGPIDRALAGPLLRFGLPFMPSRVALWALNLSNRLLVALARDPRARRRLRRRRESGLGGRAARDGVPAGLAAVRLRRSRTTTRRARVYRSVLTVWLLVALAVVLAARARARVADRAARGRAVARRRRCDGAARRSASRSTAPTTSSASPSGRAKRTQLNWVVTGHRGGHERRALHRADPRPTARRARARPLRSPTC